MINNVPYKKRKKYNKETTVYGFCIHEKAKNHFLFNRDYLVLPVTLPDETMEQLKSIYKGSVQNKLHGHGKYKSNKILDDGYWTTYFLLDDSNSPNWNKSSLEYKKSFYE